LIPTICKTANQLFEILTILVSIATYPTVLLYLPFDNILRVTRALLLDFSRETDVIIHGDVAVLYMRICWDVGIVVREIRALVDVEIIAVLNNEESGTLPEVDATYSNTQETPDDGEEEAEDEKAFAGFLIRATENHDGGSKEY